MKSGLREGGTGVPMRVTRVGSGPVLVLTGVRQQKKRTLPAEVVRRALWRMSGLELGLESWVDVRSGQQEGFPDRREQVSVFYLDQVDTFGWNRGLAEGAWEIVSAHSVSVFTSAVSPHLHCKHVAIPAFA